MQHAVAPTVETPDIAYEDDFVLWADHQTRLLRDGRLGELDIVHLIEEVEGMGNSHRDEVENRLTVLLAHLLKWKYQPGRRCGIWQGTIVEQRRRIARGIRRAPSLKGCPREVFPDCHLSARLEAAKDTGMDFSIFAEVSPFTLDQALDPAFLPKQPDFHDQTM